MAGGMGTFFTLILFVFMFAGWLIVLGANAPQITTYIAVPLSILNSPFPPAPTPPTFLNQTGTTQVCLISAFGVQLGCATVPKGSSLDVLSQWLGFIANFIGYVALFIFRIFQDMGALLFLIFGLTQALNATFGIPYLGFIFDAFIVMFLSVAIFAVRGSGP